MSQQAIAPAPPGWTWRRSALAAGAAVAVVAGAGLWVTPAPASAAPSDPVLDETTGWSYTHEALATGQTFGFQLANDPVNRTVYLTDMRNRVDQLASDGTITTTQQPTGKLVEFSTETRALVAEHDFNHLPRIDGSGPNSEQAPQEYFGNANDQGIRSYTSLRTDFGTYGVAVDPTTTYDGVVDPTIITTSARQRGTNAPVLDDQGNVVLDEFGDPATRTYGGGLVIYRASQGAPTEADVLYEFDDGVPILQGPRRIAINTETNTAYVTNLGTQRNSGPQPGYLAEIDLISREVTARIAVPEDLGAVGVAVDEENNLIYAGAMAEGGIYVIDGNAVDRSNPRDVTLSSGAVTLFHADGGGNQRPTYDPVDKRLYVASFQANTVTVYDADPASSGYGDVIQELSVGTPNAVEVDAERGLFYSANLDAKVDVYTTDTFERVLTLPNSGRAVNIAIDPVTHDVWVSNWGTGTEAVDVFEVIEPSDDPVDPVDPVEPVENEYVKPGFPSLGIPDATYYLPSEWVVGEPLTIRGEGWFNTAGTQGSAIAVKIGVGSPGDISRLEQLAVPPGLNSAPIDEEVWAIIQADADGRFTAEIEYPTSALTTSTVQAGDQVQLALLTGSLLTGDWPRAAPAGPNDSPVVTVVTEPTDPVDPVDPVLSGEITVTFGVEATDGGLSLAVASPTVDLGNATLNPSIDRLVAEGELPHVTVTDTRAADLPWAVTGTSSGFANEAGTTAQATLGWAPTVVSTTAGQTVSAGPAVTPADGFLQGSTLASALAGEGRGTAVAGAGLTLEALTNTPAGTYSGTITLTLS